MAKKKKVEKVIQIEEEIISGVSDNTIVDEKVTEEYTDEKITLVEKEEDTVKEIIETPIVETTQDFVKDNETNEIENTFENFELYKMKQRNFGFVPKKKTVNNKKPVKISFDFFWNGQSYN